jgi:hypothetical protein
MVKLAFAGSATVTSAFAGSALAAEYCLRMGAERCSFVADHN